MPKEVLFSVLLFTLELSADVDERCALVEFVDEKFFESKDNKTS